MLNNLSLLERTTGKGLVVSNTQMWTFLSDLREQWLMFWCSLWLTLEVRPLPPEQRPPHLGAT
jgi:hypothetical protein